MDKGHEETSHDISILLCPFSYFYMCVCVCVCVERELMQKV